MACSVRGAARQLPREGGITDMELEQLFEEPRIALEDVEGSIADMREAIHQKQAFGHDAGEPLDAAVGLLIGGEVVCLESWGECCGLTKAKGEAFAGDGVDRTGGVADESDVP